MSIATRIESIEEHIEQAYDELQGLGADLTNVNKNIENISMVLDDIYDSMPQVSGEGTSLTLDDTRVGKIKSTLKGNTSQSGTPTPSSPIPVNVVSGDNEINVCGKNLYSRDNGQYNVPVYATDGTSASYQDVNVVWIKVEPNKDYSFTLEPNQMQYYVRIIQCDKDKGFIARESQVNSSTTNKVILTKTTRSNCEWLQIGINQNQASQISQNNWEVMIEKNSTATTYEPYIGKSYPIYLGVLGKNLFTSKVEQGAISERPGYSYDDCKTDNTTRIRVKDLIRLDTTKSYTISIGIGYEYVIQGFNSDKKLYSIGQGSWKSVATTLTNVSYIAIAIRNTSNTTITPSEINNAKIMIEVGTSASAYEAPTPIELCKIENYQDYFYKDSGKWYLHKEIGKVVLNGTEDLKKSSKTSINRYYVSSFINTILNYDSVDIVSNYFTCITSIQSDADNIGLSKLNANGLMWNFALSDTQFDTLDKFKNWLSSNNVSVYYILATPINTEITDTTLIEQLEALKLANSYEGQTNISQVNNDLPFVISASALKKWQENTSLNSTLSMVNPLSLGNALNTQENDTQPIEVDNIEPLEEEENEES